MAFEPTEILDTDEYDAPESTNRNPRRLPPKEWSTHLRSIGFQFFQEPYALTFGRRQFNFYPVERSKFLRVACSWEGIVVAAETAVEIVTAHDELQEGGDTWLSHLKRIIELIDDLESTCGIYMSGYPTEAVWKREREIKNFGASLNALLSAPKRQGL